MMKIVLHGATDQNSSNFGDFIYGNEMYKLCSCNGNIVDYYNPSDFFKRFTYNYSEKHISIHEADLLIYFPGGYFGEVKNAGIKRCLRNFLRYMPFGLKGVLYKKKIAIVGLGAGPIYTFFLRWPLKIILLHAKLISVRDEKSKQALEKIGAHRPLNFNDMILSFDLYNQGEQTNQLKLLFSKTKEKKILLVHYNHSDVALELFAKAIKEFLLHNEDYIVVVAADSIIEDGKEKFQHFSDIYEDSLYFEYTNPFEFIELLKNIDSIVTCKLHAGVVASMFQKSVISIADHYEKTSRYYKLIGKSDRCIPLADADVNLIIDLMTKYVGDKVVIPDSIVDESQKHAEELLRLFNDVSKYGDIL